MRTRTQVIVRPRTAFTLAGLAVVAVHALPLAHSSFLYDTGAALAAALANLAVVGGMALGRRALLDG